VLAILRYAFEDVNVDAVYAKCEAGRPSNRVVEKTGFSVVGQEGQDRFYELKRSAFVAAQQTLQPAIKHGQNKDCE
jgi:RimJ/RimL family protein N-acetyltransferase